MKFRKLSLRLTVAAVMITAAAAVASSRPAKLRAVRMRALVVAVSAYDEKLGYRPLNSLNDVPRIRATLELHGFDSANIKVVTDRDATREGILSALRALVNESAAGDVVVIHYSGHGDRLTDNNGDEIDGLDELLVPIDAPYDTTAVRKGLYNGERHIRDDDLAPLLQQLRAKVYDATQTGSVTLLVDACFSGTITRGDYELPSRGTVEPLGKPASNTRGDGKDEGSGAGELARGNDAGNLAPMVVMSAARQDQTARETRDVDAKRTPLGVFTLAFSRVLARSDAHVTYRAVMHQVAAEIDAMGYSQRPQLEGDIDALLFSARSVPQKPYYTIRDFRNDSTVRIRGGNVVGVMEGAEITFYPVGTRNPDSAATSAIAKGVVRRANEVSAEIAVPLKTDTARLRNSWAFVTRASMGDVRVRVKIENTLAAPQRTALKKSLAQLGIVQLVDSIPDIVIDTGAEPVSRGARPVAVRSAYTNEVIAGPLPVNEKLDSIIEQRVTTYARGRFVKERVQMKDPRISVQMDLLPARHIFDSDGACEKSEVLPAGTRKSRSGEIELQPDDGFVLQVKNNGQDAAYVSILYIMPNGKIFQLFPNKEHSNESNHLEPGREHRISLCYSPDSTPGAHTIKLFATREPVNFEPVLERGGTRSGGDNPLERLLGEAVGSRDPGTKAPARGTGTTTSLLLHVVPKQ